MMHTASPAPGRSRARIKHRNWKLVPLKITTSYLSFYCFWFIQPFSNNEVRFLQTEPHSHLSMLMCKEFSRIVCVSLFSYQGCLSLRQLIHYIMLFLTCQELFLSFFQIIFFNMFAVHQQLVYFIIRIRVCQELFYLFLHFFVKITEKEGFEPSRRVSDLYP